MTLSMWESRKERPGESGQAEAARRGTEKEALADLGDLSLAAKYLFATIFCAVFGAIYEHFSFGVYSGCMVYAFGFPLLLGVLPFFLRGLKGSRGMKKRRWSENFWHAGVATLTVGSVVKGVLDIYGTDSPYVIWYGIIGVSLFMIVMVDAIIAKSERL